MAEKAKVVVEKYAADFRGLTNKLAAISMEFGMQMMVFGVGEKSGPVGINIVKCFTKSGEAMIDVFEAQEAALALMVDALKEDE